MAFLPGKDGGLTVAAAVWKINEWTLDMGGELSDVTNFVSAGFKENCDALTGANITFSGAFDSTAMAIAKGTSYALVLKMSATVSIAVTARVKNINIRTKVDDAVRVQVTAESTGSFTPSIA